MKGYGSSENEFRFIDSPAFYLTEKISCDVPKVVVFTNTTGTHKGPFMFAPGISSSGKHISFRTADLHRIADNKIAEHWDVVEYLKMLYDLGAIKISIDRNNTQSCQR